MSSEIKRWDVQTMDERTSSNGKWVLHSDHEAVVDSMTAALVKLDGACLASEQEVARLRAEDSYQKMLLEQAKGTILNLRAEVDGLRSVANAARQVAAWFSSGNNVPVSGVHQMTVSSSSIMADVHVLNEALATMGASA